MAVARKVVSTNDKKTLYFQALEIAYSEFIDKEKKGNLFTELRLIEKIKAARTLYK